MSEDTNQLVPADAEQAADAKAMMDGTSPSPAPAPPQDSAPTTPPASPETPAAPASPTQPLPASPETKPEVPSAQPPVDIAKVVAETIKSTMTAVAPKPEAPKAAEPTPWKPFQVDAKFVDTLIEDSEKGAAAINTMIEGVVKSVLELALPYVNQTVAPLIDRAVQSDVVAARQEFAKTYPDMASEGDIQWAEEVARQMLAQGKKFDSNKAFFDAVYQETKALKETYRKRLGVTGTPAPTNVVPIPGATTGNGPRGNAMSLTEEQKDMLRVQGIPVN